MSAHLNHYPQYCYHRTTHEADSLWFIHQHHHTTKHPVAILSILAEDYQEFLEVFAVPLCASLIVPLSFSEMWITLCYTIVSCHRVASEPRWRLRFTFSRDSQRSSRSLTRIMQYVEMAGHSGVRAAWSHPGTSAASMFRR